MSLWYAGGTRADDGLYVCGDEHTRGTRGVSRQDVDGAVVAVVHDEGGL